MHPDDIAAAAARAQELDALHAQLPGEIAAAVALAAEQRGVLAQLPLGPGDAP